MTIGLDGDEETQEHILFTYTMWNASDMKPRRK